ncbi:ABC transporter permease protein [Paenibacillus sp. TCA20]|uniref:ABC transporter permease n=1 Tax=Paenibacillus TaxID=44249 RepID=UPI0004D68332|nr:ABC transporter permease [Paenibacillus sp. TCA20]GAK40372.1 ABC transporter permease protein [Paenibacillus sp. TCA20]
MNKLGTIIGFTYKQKAKTKAFKITTLILAILMTIGMNIPYVIDMFAGNDGESGGNAPADIPAIGLVVGEQQASAQALEEFVASQQVPALHFITYEQADAPELKTDLADEVIEGYVELHAAGDGTAPMATYYAEDANPSPAVMTTIQTGLQNAKTKSIVQDALSPEQIEAISVPAVVDVQEVSVEEDAAAGSGADVESAAVDYIFVYVLMILFFFSIIMTGNMIASEITAEKSSRIMEILITSVSPLTQMFGKIIGIFLLSLTQIGIFGLVIFGNLMLPHNIELLRSIDIDLSTMNLDVLIYGFLFYILGFFLYAVLFAAIGSIVSRTEELGQALTPMTMLSLVAFYIGIFSLSTPNSLLVQISSFVPFTSPTVMILRIGMGEIAVWEIWVSLILLVASILVFGWLSAKIYRTGVLMYGKRPSIKELRKAMKAYKI